MYLTVVKDRKKEYFLFVSFHNFFCTLNISKLFKTCGGWVTSHFDWYRLNTFLCIHERRVSFIKQGWTSMLQIYAFHSQSRDDQNHYSLRQQYRWPKIHNNFVFIRETCADHKRSEAREKKYTSVVAMEIECLIKA